MIDDWPPRCDRCKKDLSTGPDTAAAHHTWTFGWLYWDKGDDGKSVDDGPYYVLCTECSDAVNDAIEKVVGEVS